SPGKEAHARRDDRETEDRISCEWAGGGEWAGASDDQCCGYCEGGTRDERELPEQLNDGAPLGHNHRTFLVGRASLVVHPCHCGFDVSRKPPRQIRMMGTGYAPTTVLLLRSGMHVLGVCRSLPALYQSGPRLTLATVASATGSSRECRWAWWS